MHVVMLSGGLDSAVVLAKVIADYGTESVLAVWVNYGQRLATQERKAVNDLAEWYDVQLEKVAVVPPLGRGIALLDSKPDIPDATYDEIDVVSTGLYVPVRNAFLLMIGANRAWPSGTVYYGAHSADSPYADCSPEFVDAIRKAIEIGSYGRVTIEAPLLYMTKTDIVRLGSKLNVPFELTYSCYKGWDIHCGTCPTSVDGDTLVLMADWTWKPIKDIVIGEYVIGVDHTAKPARFVPTRVIDKFVHGPKLVKIYSTPYGRIAMTPDHRILTQYTKSYNTVYREVDRVLKSKFKVGYSIPYTVVDNDFLWGWFAGYMHHDGTRTRGHTGKVYGWSCISHDIEVLEDVANVAQKLGFSVKISRHYSKGYKEGYYPMLRVSNGDLVPKVEEIIDKITDGVSRNIKLGYIAGAIDADGYINQEIRFTQMKEDRIETFVNVLDQINLSYTIQDHSPGTIVTIPSKYAFMIPFQTRHRRRQWSRSIQRLQVPVSYTGISYTTYVWDITTETGNFIANGLIVHNCRQRRTAFIEAGVPDPTEYEREV